MVISRSEFNQRLCYNKSDVRLCKGGGNMEKLMYVASYVCNRYYDEFNSRIDEMKLHKLLYFAQRESLIQNDTPLFDATFYGWKFGPVLKEIRVAYRDDTFYEVIPLNVIGRIKNVIDRVFDEYAAKDSWSLSRLTHGEYSWKQSRIGIPDGENGNVPMKLSDIYIDADRIRERRVMLSRLGLC